MRYPIRIQISDPKSALSSVDQQQVENMIWLRLSPIKEMIGNVWFEITHLDHEEFGREHVVRTTTKLKSGHVVESFTTRISKGAVLMAAVDHMKSRVERRIRFETGWVYQSVRLTRNAASSLFQSMGTLFRLLGHTGSSSAS